MSILSRLRRRSGASSVASFPDARRTFFRRMGGFSVGALGVGLLTADEAWAAVAERANLFGIAPGTLVEAKGRPLDRAPNGTDPFMGEIMLVPYNFAPRGWALCQGQLLQVSSNTAQFSLLGTTYGGDG